MKSVFQSLCESLAEQNHKNNQFRKAAHCMSGAFCSALRVYMNAPEKWFTKENEERSYVSLRQVNERWEVIESAISPVSSMRFVNNFYIFQIVVVLEPAQNSSQKDIYAFNCGIKPQSELVCRLFIEKPGTQERNEFECSPTENPGDNARTDFSEPVEHVVDLLREMVAVDPFSQQ